MRIFILIIIMAFTACKKIIEHPTVECNNTRYIGTYAGNVHFVVNSFIHKDTTYADTVRVSASTEGQCLLVFSKYAPSPAYVLPNGIIVKKDGTNSKASITKNTFIYEDIDYGPHASYILWGYSFKGKKVW